jgi:hypothetical protein
MHRYGENNYLHVYINSNFEKETKMRKMKKRRPAPYSTTDEQETLAIDTFRNLTDHRKVKLDIKERDKYPNVDGYVEIVDEFRAPIAKLEVQIKKLPNEEPKIQCPLSLLSYSEKTCNPVLFIGVDIKQKKAYWVHVEENLIVKSISGSDQETKVISFPVDNVLDGKDTKYIAEWKDIAETYQTRIRSYGELADLYDRLSKRLNPALGIDKKVFRDIHVFLDEINMLLDENFSIVKRIFYPTAWKVGLAYYGYEDNSLSYTLYPISFTRNDVQIKEGNDLLRKELWTAGLGITGHNVENPIKLRPREYAIEIVESKTLRILKNRLLNHRGNEFLATEFIFAFIDKFLQQLGLNKKDKYSIDEIDKAFFQHLPIWVDESIRFIVKVQRNRVRSPMDLLYRKPYFDPDMLICQIMNDERRQIEQTVRTRIRQKSDIPRIPLGNDRFPFGIFAEFFLFLRSRGLQEIDRPYSPRDYSRLSGRGGWVWNVFSPDAVETNLKMFFDNLPKVYNDVILQNFPKIAEELPLFGDASRVIILFDVKEEYKIHRDAPTISFFHFETEKKESLEIEIYRKEENELPDLSWKYLGKHIKIKGKKYRFISGSRGVLDFIYDYIPMFNFVYKVLEENLKGYFNSLREHHKT